MREQNTSTKTRGRTRAIVVTLVASLVVVMVSMA